MTTMGGREYRDPAICEHCGAELDWIDCWQCEDGLTSLYYEDPINYDPDDTEDCDNCEGASGWLGCPYAESHRELEGD